MAKGRKLTTSRSERFLGNLGYDRDHGASNGPSELREDEVWSMVDDTVNGDSHSSGGEWSARASSESNGSFGSYSGISSRPPPPRPDHHHRRQVGGLSLAFDDPSDSSSLPRIVHQFRTQDNVAESPRGRHMATSAPVNIPDWSKIYRVDSVESMHDSDDGLNDDWELVPPHEYLARSRKMAANSVFEGVGRTLKGRDLSRVRDAVWSQTGFYG
ncbi:hypothetical protein PHJA_000049700 [Phtheirospermum japonicum]|uniref:Senescence regulator n=1 Tax=Phtheirospermum japonicum TaxID=374723 RepID=A0A830B112_9LAMI|nr:hypothetical protein PHJA_000049700 [Phtheirospermum japonicum]